jgi:hypothetical protein
MLIPSDALRQLRETLETLQGEHPNLPWAHEHPGRLALSGRSSAVSG